MKSYRKTKANFNIFLRPVKISDEPLLKDFFYSLSNNSLYHRFISARKDVPHERLQDFVIIDRTCETLILAVIKEAGKEKVAGLGEYRIDETKHIAEVAFAVRDDYQNKGIATELLYSCKTGF